MYPQLTEAMPVRSGSFDVRRSASVLGAVLCVFFCAWFGSQAADLRLTDANPLDMPKIGSWGLRILSPTVLELTFINTKAADAARVTNWDFVSEDLQLQLPNPSELLVSVDGRQVAVEKVGFKRRPLYAPLKKQDLRIANQLYLQLASPVSDQETVEVKNPSGELWSTAMEYKASAEPLRWSPALHVNQVGYLPSFPKKGMVGYYLGSLGELSIPAAAGFELIDPSGTIVYHGQLTRRADVGYTYAPAPYQEVWEADFSSFKAPGRYRLLVPGLGVSYPFLIDEGVAAAFARTYALGIFHQRCGMDEEFPFTRHVHGVCHAGPVQVPDMTFTAVNNELANMSRDFATYQIAPQLKDVRSSLFPFVDLRDRDVTGGHHDAGDYSRYTINSAGFIHYLVFAADAFPGVVDLDNLGLPESGDGKSDVLQEAKWEADFLAKMQDTDGGFYFLVYPRDREYEDDVLPDKGDPQVVFPKTTAVTAAAVAALAEAGSSPAFRQQFPVQAARYVEKARHGWSFLQSAIAKYGKAGAYQKITHYGNEFGHDDELAWAACALYAATGEEAYHQQLKAWYDPSDLNTRRWSWWRLFEGYGCAARTYAFAARSGRVPAGALDPVYLAKCEAEIRAAADDQVRFARGNAYGTSFPDPNKAYRTAGWYFSSERAFDITVAYQLDPRKEYLEAVISNLNYEGGCNPVNVTYVTGLGTRRQREIVQQYAENDRRVLSPSGLPLGNVQSGFQYLYNYLGDLEGLSFPPDGATFAPYPYYDRWGDSFNTTTEFVITDQARSLASLCFWMAQTPLGAQPWRSAAGQITGVPGQIPAEQPVTATLIAQGVDLTNAQIVWEGRDQEPQFGNPATFAAKSSGDQWVEVEAQLPDGRRIFAVTNFHATASLDAPANSYQSAPLSATPDMVALYHLDGDLSDATGKHQPLVLAGNAWLDQTDLSWMSSRQGAALRCNDLGDHASILLPAAELRSGSDTTAILLEAMIYIDAFVGYNRGVASIVSLENSWDAFLEFGEDKYTGPYIRGGTSMDLKGPTLTGVLSVKRWHHLAIEVNQGGYVVRVDGNVIASLLSDDLKHWGSGATAKLKFGNFSGWVDEVVVRSVRTGAPPNSSPTVNLISPSQGSSFSAPATVTLSADAADVDGTISRVEFYEGLTKIGEVGNGAYPYNFVWNGVPPGIYSITAKAIDDRGASTWSAPVGLTVHTGTQAVATPSISPPGGDYSNPVSVTVTTATPGATIRYTIDGSVPNANSSVYNGPIVLSGSATLLAKSFKSGMAESEVAGASFAVTAISPSGARVTFVKTDAVTRGNWRGVYGSDGYTLAGNATRYPGYLEITTAGKTDYTWSDTTQDRRALQQAIGSGRIAAVWYSSIGFTADLDFTDGGAHRLAVYCLDWDSSGRSETIEILDGTSGVVLNRQSVSGFQEGKYLVWDLKGRLRLKVTRLSGPNAVLSGLFLDPRPQQATGAPVAAVLSCTATRNTTGGGLSVQVAGEAAQQYVLEASTNLVDWTPVSTNLVGAGEADIRAAQASAPGWQFYRARALVGVQSKYLVEVSTDVVHWSPASVSASSDLTGLRQTDATLYSSRVYRVIPVAAGEQLYLLEESADGNSWAALRTQSSSDVPMELLDRAAGSSNMIYRTQPLF